MSDVVDFTRMKFDDIFNTFHLVFQTCKLSLQIFSRLIFRSLDFSKSFYHVADKDEQAHHGNQDNQKYQKVVTFKHHLDIVHGMYL